MIREVLRMGDRRLLEQARPVAGFDTPELHDLLADMRDTMAHLNGAGLAAPQIGVLINPVLAPIGDEVVEGWEGCLSVPGMRGLVPRHRRLRYTGFDERGHPIDRTVEGFHAVVVQHEVDHLLGVLYPMRVRDMTKFGFIDALFPGTDVRDD
jgi:peptide deformylase